MNPILDFISSLSIFIVPVLIGSMFGGSLVRRALKGLLTIFSIFFLAKVVSLFFPFSIVLSSLLWICIVLGSIKSIFGSDRKRIKGFVSKIRPFHLVMTLWVGAVAWYAFFWLFKALTPYPYSVNWDVFEHITLAQHLLSGQVSFFPSHISDTFTFDGYTPLFHMLLAIPEALFHASFLGTYYFTEWWFYLLTVCSSIAFSYNLFRTKTAAISAGIISLFAFASTVVYLPLFFLPQTLTALLCICFLFEVKEVSRENLVDILFSALALVMLHFVIGSVGVGLFVLWHGYPWVEKKLQKTWFPTAVLYVSLGIVVVSLLLHLTGGIHLTTREEALYYQFSLSQLAAFFSTWYGITGIILLPLGIFSLWNGHDEIKKQIGLLSLGLIALSFSPFSYTLKFFSLGWFFILLVMVAAVELILVHLPKKLQAIPLICLFVASLFVYYGNEIQYKQFLYHNGKESHISADELAAAAFIRTQGPHVFLISDPATQGVMEALSESNSQGGVYMNLETRKILSGIKSTSPENSESVFSQVTDVLPYEKTQAGKRFFIASGRYFAWQEFPETQKESVYFNVWRPRTLTADDQEKIETYKAAGLREIYHNSEMSIFEL